ncbi:hypothetical protein AAHC03_013668 [Spirometra sp. Aus1]
MPERADEQTSSAHLLKRTNDRKVLCILYLSTMAATSIAVSVQAMDETKSGLTAVIQDMILGTLYATSSLLLFGITVYFFVRRNQTFESARDSIEQVSFIVKYSSHGEPINLYLRIGLAIFALMSVGQSSVRISQIAKGDTVRWPEIYKTAFELNFYVCQTTFILVYHRIVILDSHELFGASLIHILGTNLCMWADVTVEKIKSTLHLYGSLPSNDSAHANHNTNGYSASEEENSTAIHASFYLLPAVSEYCLLSAALIYEITKRIGEPSYIELEEDEGHKKRDIKKQVRYWGAMIKSGYWSPIVIVSVIVILTIVTGVTPKDKVSYWKCAVLFTEEMFLDCMGIFVTLAAFLRLRHLKFTIPLRPKNIDEFQLYIAFSFTVIYLVATVALASYLLRDLNYPYKVQDLLMGRLTLDLLELLEVIIQTYLIQDCFRRCSEEEVQRNSKPGRQMIAILLGINLAGWVVKSFQLKEADILYVLTDNAPYAWVLIAIAMPVYLFYRYHSTVCLSEAFTILYEDETSRFEALWRQNPIYLAKLLSHPNLAVSQGNALYTSEKHDEHPDRSRDQIPQRKLSAQNINTRDIFGRHASFFNPQGMNLRAFSTVSFADSQIMSFEPGVNRFSQTGMYQPQPRTRLPDSETLEGPNYFLSYDHGMNSPPHRGSPLPLLKTDGHVTQTGPAAYETTQSDKPEVLPQPIHNPNHYTQRKASHSHLHQSASSQAQPTLVNRAEDSSEGIARRPTLANLQAAKDRVRAAENEHKRVLERANSGYVASSVTKKPSHQANRHTGPSRKVATADQSGLIPQKNTPKPKQSPPAPAAKTPESQLPTSASGLAFSQEPKPPVSATKDATVREGPTKPTTPLRRLEPSKVLPLLMASNFPPRFPRSPSVDTQETSESDISSTRAEEVQILSSRKGGAPNSPPPPSRMA